MAGYVLLDDEPASASTQKGYVLLDDAPAQPTSRGFAAGVGDVLAGALRGAGSIGATVLTPWDMARDAIAGKGLSLESNRQRRADMDSALSTMGADTDSWAYKGGKLVGEVAGTAGVGGAVANVAGRGLGAVAPSLLPKAQPLLSAIQSGGMTAPGAGMFTRVAGGAINGAATAGMVNPEDAGIGAGLGGAMPLVTKGLGAIGSTLGQIPKPGVNPTTLQTARDGIDAGYVVPPNMLKPSFANQVIESISGKQATQQIASMRNSEVTEGLVRKALGIADDVPLTQGTMESLRKTAGKAYADVSNLSPQAAADLEALKVARNEAQGWFKAYNRSASPDDLAKAKAARSLADQLETALENHAKDAGVPELIPALRDARKAIAKTYTVGRALNDATGTVDARILGRMSEKGLPLSDGLEVAGKFASAFPTITKSPMQVGSPAAHNLKSIASMAMGGGGFAALGPLGAAAAAVPFVAPPMARSIMFREGAQRGLLSSPPQPSAIRGLLTNIGDEFTPMLYRSNALLGSSG